MPDAKISASPLGATPADGDLFSMVDVSDTTMAPTGSNKYATYAEIKSGITAGGQTLYDIVVAPSGGDYTTLGEALAVATTGQSIYVRAGTYNESAITSSLANITIVGESNTKSIINIGTTAWSMSGNYCTIANVYIQASSGRLAMTGTNATLRDCYYVRSGVATVTGCIDMPASDATIINLNYSTSVPGTIRTMPIIKSINARFKMYGCTIMCSQANTVTDSSIAVVMSNGANALIANNAFYGSNGAYQTIVVRGAAYGSITGNTFSNIGGISIFLSSGTHIAVTGNVIDAPTMTINGYGIYTSSATGCTITGNTVRAGSSPSYLPIYLANGGSDQTLSNNMVTANNTAAITVAASNSIISNNRITRGAAGVSIAVTGETGIVSGNMVNGWGATTVTPITDNTSTTMFLNNYYQSHSGIVPIPERKITIFKNSSGTTFANGSILVMKATATGYEVTTTTTAGDNRVVGMSMSAFGDTESAHVLTLGKTVYLKVDGTTDIAVGDYISCHTVAGVGAKASAGHTAIAIALEAYTADNSSGVIDALIIPPRMV